MTHDVSRFQDDQGEWLEHHEWPSVPHVVTCRTPGCPREGDPIEVDLHENVDGVFRAVCGPCGQPHTDMKEKP